MDRQRTSLERLAARNGMTPEQLIAITQRDTQDTLDHMISQTSHVVDKFGSFAGVSLEQFQTRIVQMKDRDFWQDIADRENCTHLFAVQAIAKVAKYLPINWQYVQNLAKRHQLPSPSTTSDDMIAFLGAVPCAYVFDHEFNAYIEWNEHSYAPCVFYNTLLLDSLAEVSQLMSLCTKSPSHTLVSIPRNTQTEPFFLSNDCSGAAYWSATALSWRSPAHFSRQWE